MFEKFGSPEKFIDFRKELLASARIEKLPLGGSGVILVEGVSFDTVLELILLSNIHPVHLYPNKPSFAVLSGNTTALPDVLITDGKLLQVNVGYNVPSQRYVSEKWQFVDPISYISTVSFSKDDENQEPTITIQSRLKHREFVKRVKGEIPSVNVIVHRHSTP